MTTHIFVFSTWTPSPFVFFRPFSTIVAVVICGVGLKGMRGRRLLRDHGGSSSPRQSAVLGVDFAGLEGSRDVPRHAGSVWRGMTFLGGLVWIMACTTASNAEYFGRFEGLKRRRERTSDLWV